MDAAHEKVFSALRKEGTSRSDVAAALHLYPQDLNALVFGLASLSTVDGAAADGCLGRPDDFLSGASPTAVSAQ